MAWIESHQSLGTHRKLFQLAEALNISRPQAVGHLHFLWWWALDNAPDGSIKDIPAKVVAGVSEWRGDPLKYLVALSSAGWLDPDGTLHDWYDYAGKLLEKRVLTSEQKRIGGQNRMAKLSPEERSALAQKAINTRWQYQHNTSTDTSTHLVEIPATVPNRTQPNRTVPTTPYSPPAAANSLRDKKTTDITAAGADPATLEETGLDNSSGPAAGDSKDDKNYAAICQCYEQNIQMLTPLIAEELKEVADKYSPGWFAEAVKEAGEVRKLKYILSILERWQVEGYKSQKKPQYRDGDKLHDDNQDRFKNQRYGHMVRH